MQSLEQLIILFTGIHCPDWRSSQAILVVSYVPQKSKERGCLVNKGLRCPHSNLSFCMTLLRSFFFATLNGNSDDLSLKIRCHHRANAVSFFLLFSVPGSRSPLTVECDFDVSWLDKQRVLATLRRTPHAHSLKCSGSGSCSGGTSFSPQETYLGV